MVVISEEVEEVEEVRGLQPGFVAPGVGSGGSFP
jgi:hypothetical protein